MAHRLKWWIAGPALACLVIALAYLPPRGMRALPFGLTFWLPRTESAAIERRNQLAAEWQRRHGELQAARLRTIARPLLAAEQDAGRPPKVVVVAQDSASYLQNLLRLALDSAWRQLELGDTKIGVVLASPAMERDGDHPQTFRHWRTYLLPDTTNRTTCVVVLPSANLIRTQPRQFIVAQRVRSALGPCAFYAKFGAPSPRVRRWLDANNYDVTEASDWSAVTRGRDFAFDLSDLSILQSGPGGIWFSYLYGMDFNTIACIAERESACLKGWTQGDREGLGPYRTVVTPGERWRFSDNRLPQPATVLAEVVKAAGDEAFQEFWTTSLPIDSALSLAVEQPAGAWLASRSKAAGLNVRLGPTPPTSSILQAVLIALGLVVIAALMVGRRQVR